MTHWYDKNEGAKFEVLAKNGLPRKTTLRDAKKEVYYPGVNDCLNVAPSYSIIGYKERKTPKYIAEKYKDALGIKDAGQWVKEQMNGANEAALVAPLFGTKVHQVFKHIIDWKKSGQKYDIPEEFRAYAKLMWNFYEEHNLTPIELEKTIICNKHGYGGTLDYFGGFREHPDCIVDWKTQVFNDRKKSGEFKAAFYDNFPVQLAAYAAAYKENGLDSITLVSVVIDSRPLQNGNKPLVEYKVYDKEKNHMYFDLFLCCRKLWASEMFNNWEPLNEQTKTS